jgi:hypothetical protein
MSTYGNSSSERMAVRVGPTCYSDNSLRPAQVALVLALRPRNTRPGFKPAGNPMVPANLRITTPSALLRSLYIDSHPTIRGERSLLAPGPSNQEVRTRPYDPRGENVDFHSIALLGTEHLSRKECYIDEAKYDGYLARKVLPSTPTDQPWAACHLL